MHKNQVFFIGGLLFAIIVAIFALTNDDAVTIQLLFWKVNGSQALVIFLSAALGAVVMALLGTVRYVRKLNENKRLRREIETLKKEIQFLEAETPSGLK